MSASHEDEELFLSLGFQSKRTQDTEDENESFKKKRRNHPPVKEREVINLVDEDDLLNQSPTPSLIQKVVQQNLMKSEKKEFDMEQLPPVKPKDNQILSFDESLSINASISKLLTPKTILRPEKEFQSEEISDTEFLIQESYGKISSATQASNNTKIEASASPNLLEEGELVEEHTTPQTLAQEEAPTIFENLENPSTNNEQENEEIELEFPSEEVDIEEDEPKTPVSPSIMEHRELWVNCDQKSITESTSPTPNTQKESTGTTVGENQTNFSTLPSLACNKLLEERTNELGEDEVLIEWQVVGADKTLTSWELKQIIFPSPTLSISNILNSNSNSNPTIPKSPVHVNLKHSTSSTSRHSWISSNPNSSVTITSSKTVLVSTSPTLVKVWKAGIFECNASVKLIQGRPFQIPVSFDISSQAPIAETLNALQSRIIAFLEISSVTGEKEVTKLAKYFQSRQKAGALVLPNGTSKLYFFPFSSQLLSLISGFSYDMRALQNNESLIGITATTKEKSAHSSPSVPSAWVSKGSHMVSS